MKFNDRKENIKMEIKIIENTNPIVKPEKIEGFGKQFTNHMFVADYTREKGWFNARIEPFANLSLHPASTVFHYGAEIFEGLKAYRRADGKVQLFRPIENVRRMNNSAERLRLPLMDENDMLQAITEFVKHEQDWVPSGNGESLYLRPFLFGNDETLGVHSINAAKFVIIASPSGSYYKEGINPVKIMIEKDDVRAVRGGTGYAKCGGNYAASCIELLKSKGYTVSERLLSIDELVDALENGKLEEAWGCGTAAVVSPIGLLEYDGKQYTVNDGKIGEVTQTLYDTLTGIQWGKAEDTFGWTLEI